MIMVVKKYGFRNWAVYDETGELVCVTVYKKGAFEVARRLGDVIFNKPAKPETKSQRREGFYYVR